MPELPEVETTLRGIAPHLIDRTIKAITVRNGKLRWPVTADIQKSAGEAIIQLSRRGKYLLLHLSSGVIIIHLGMSGRLQILTKLLPPQKHDHIDVILDSGVILRYTDPRRFGAFLWTEHLYTHPLLAHLGPEPLSDDFSGEYLFERTKKRKAAIKLFIMDQKIVVGVGNIYANEALFFTHIHPVASACTLIRAQCDDLVHHIKQVLQQAIKQGGTTLKDFLDSNGKPGYFSQKLQVYGRANKPCLQCKTTIESIILGQRNTFFCPSCQK